MTDDSKEDGGPVAASTSSASSVGGLVAVFIAAMFLLVPTIVAFAETVSSSGLAGVTLIGCTGTATSQGKGSVPISLARVPGSPPSSPDHPFVVTKSGVVPWEGKSNAVITDHKWEITSYGVQVKSGGSKNEGKVDEKAGTEKVKDYLPISTTGLFEVAGHITGSAKCSGNMWVKIEGSPLGTPAWFLGIVFVVGGLVIIVFARPSVPGGP